MSPLNPSRGSTFCSGKIFFLSLAYRFSHDQAHADFSCSIIRPLALSILKNHLHIPKSAISFQYLDLLTDYLLSMQCPVLPSVSFLHPQQTHKSIPATLKVRLNLIFWGLSILVQLFIMMLESLFVLFIFLSPSTILELTVCLIAFFYPQLWLSEWINNLLSSNSGNIGNSMLAQKLSLYHHRPWEQFHLKAEVF